MRDRQRERLRYYVGRVVLIIGLNSVSGGRLVAASSRLNSERESQMKRITKEKLQELHGLAKLLTVMGVRNNPKLEDLHSGMSPYSETGDFSDVKVVSPYREIEWNRLSRLDDEEMRSLMLSIERDMEAALYAYERLSVKDRKATLRRVLSRRTYDLPRT